MPVHPTDSDDPEAPNPRGLSFSAPTAANPLEVRWQAQQVLENLFGVAERTQVSHYEILRELGKGAMGIVYLAQDHALQRKVAIKILQSSSNEPLVAEARSLARLKHPNIVTIYEIDSVENAVFIVMEYVDGLTLEHWLDCKRPLTEVLEVFVQAGAGLAAAHDAGLVHRDFKPANVMVTENSGPHRVRVLDFGLARDDPSKNATIILPSRSAISKMTVAGTLRYMAPEQFSAKWTDARSDQFAFCITLFEALYHCHPFGDTVGEMLSAAERGTLRIPSGSDGVPSEILAILTRGLCPVPSGRFESMHELLEAIVTATGRFSSRVASAGDRGPSTAPSARLTVSAGPGATKSAVTTGTREGESQQADMVGEAKAPVPAPPKIARYWKWYGGIAVALILVLFGTWLGAAESTRVRQKSVEEGHAAGRDIIRQVDAEREHNTASETAKTNPTTDSSTPTPLKMFACNIIIQDEVMQAWLYINTGEVKDVEVQGRTVLFDCPHSGYTNFSLIVNLLDGSIGYYPDVNVAPGTVPTLSVVNRRAGMPQGVSETMLSIETVGATSYGSGTDEEKRVSTAKGVRTPKKLRPAQVTLVAGDWGTLLVKINGSSYTLEPVTKAWISPGRHVVWTRKAPSEDWSRAGIIVVDKEKAYRLLFSRRAGLRLEPE